MQQGIRELEGDERLGFVLAPGCGLRWGEIVSLSWENVLPEGVRVLASLAKGRRVGLCLWVILCGRCWNRRLGQGL